MLITLTLFFFSAFTYSQCFTTVNTGYAHVTAKKSDGTFWVWGSGGIGQLGNTTNFDENSPIMISGLTNLHSLTSGGFSTFAIKTNGTLWATGYNLYGGLGIGSTVQNISNFVQVGTATNWKQIAPTEFFTVALKTDNTIWGWGQNDGYQMGNGICCSNQLTPIQISTNTDWKMVGTSNARSAFALKDNGTIWCWGSNIAGLLGDNLLSERPIPTQHNADTEWNTISVGAYHILALKTNGSLWAWGGGDSGETGDGLPVNYNRYIPRQIGIANNWKTMAAGERFSMGIKTDGTLWAWGKNDVGQLGDGTTTNQPLPVQIGTATNWDSVASGYQHTVALKTDGSLWTWGTNEVGQLGNGTTTAVVAPTNVTIAGCVLATTDFVSLAANIILNPNPVKNDLNLNYKGSELVNTIVIYDLTGREVYSSQSITAAAFSCTLNVGQLQSGNYVVVLKNNDKTVVSKKLIKK